MNDSKDLKELSKKMKNEEIWLQYEEEIEKNARDEDIKKFARTFNKLLKEKGISNRSFARSTDISPSSVINYRRGITMPNNDILKIISKYFDISVNHLLGIDECKKVTAQQVYNMLGLNEYAMEHLYSLNHDIEEVKEMEIDAPVSDTFKKQLETLSLLIADKRNLIYILNAIGRYFKKKQELLKLKEETDEKGLIKEQIESLARDIVHIKAEIQEYLYMSLDYIVDKLLKEEER